jgi:hypothetical protein
LSTSYAFSTLVMSSSLGTLKNVILFTKFWAMMKAVAGGIYTQNKVWMRYC